MLSHEQYELRRTGITASDLVSLLFPTRKRNPLTVYASKVCGAPPGEETMPMRLGHLLEPVAIRILSEERKLAITPGVTERSSRYGFLLATPDGNVLDAPRGSRVAVAECKAVGAHRVHLWEEGPPEEVLVQVQTQITVCEVSRAHVVALLGATDYAIHDVDHDPELEAVLIETARDFWARHVERKSPPAADGAWCSPSVLSVVYKRSRAELLPADAETHEYALGLLAIREHIKELEARADRLSIALCERIGEAEGLSGPGWQAKWTPRKGAVSWKEVALALGATEESAAAYRGNDGRVFQIKRLGAEKKVA